MMARGSVLTFKLASTTVFTTPSRRSCEHVIRTVYDPNVMYPINSSALIRTVRFAARYGFEIDSYTSKAIQEHIHYCDNLSPSLLNFYVTKGFTDGCGQRTYKYYLDNGILGRYALMLTDYMNKKEYTDRLFPALDYFDEQHPSPLGLFTIVARPVQEPADEAEKLMSHALCARLAEAGACSMQNAQCSMQNAQCTMHNGQRSMVNGQCSMVNGQCSMVNGQCSPLRVAFGYASSPDHSLKRIVFDRLDAERQLGITLTDRYSIQPSTSICGMFIFHREARYFPVGRIDRAQLTDYCRRRGITVEEGERLLSKYITSS